MEMRMRGRRGFARKRRSRKTSVAESSYPITANIEKHIGSLLVIETSTGHACQRLAYRNYSTLQIVLISALTLFKSKG